MAFRASRKSVSPAASTNDTTPGTSPEAETVVPAAPMSVEDLVGAPKAAPKSPVVEKPKTETTVEDIREHTASDFSSRVRPPVPVSYNSPRVEAGSGGSRSDRPYTPRGGGYCAASRGDQTLPTG